MKNENKIISGPTFVSNTMVPDACATPVIDRKKRRGRCCKTSLSSLECFSFSSSLLGSSATLCARTGFFLTKMGGKGVKMFNKLGETQKSGVCRRGKKAASSYLLPVKCRVSHLQSMTNSPRGNHSLRGKHLSAFKGSTVCRSVSA